MSTPHRGTPVVVSNDPDDFIQGGGLYPGGTGIIKEIGYAFWDYNGRQPPNSSVAVKCTFSPTDGSNEGRDEPIYWSVGPATDYQPDQTGGFCFAVGTKPQIADSSNWHFVADKFVKNCGMAKGVLNGPSGIKALEGSQVTLVRMDQPERNIDNQVQTPVIPGQQQRKFKPTILVPTAAIFAWDRQGGAATVATITSTAAAVKARAAAKKTGAAAPTAPAPVPTTPAPAMTITPAPVPVATAPINGAAPVSNDVLIGEVIIEILGEVEGNAFEFANLPSLLTEKLGPQGRQITAKTRIDIIKQAKDPAVMTAIAAANGFSFDGSILSV